VLPFQPPINYNKKAWQHSLKEEHHWAAIVLSRRDTGTAFALIVRLFRRAGNAWQ